MAHGRVADKTQSKAKCMYTCDQQLECHKFSTTYHNKFFNSYRTLTIFHRYIKFADFVVAFGPQNSVLTPVMVNMSP